METATAVTVLALSLILLIGESNGLRTNPSVAENFGNVTFVAPENASNVSVFCEVTFGDGSGHLFTSVWFLTLNNGVRERINFNNGNSEIIGPQSNLTIRVSGLLQSNLTIVSFGADLDMATLECSNRLQISTDDDPNIQRVFFLLRTIG